MQQIINAILRNKTFILFITLLFLSLIFLRNRSLYHQSKFNKISIEFTGRLFNISASFKEYLNLKKTNEALFYENKKLIEKKINSKEHLNEFNDLYHVFNGKIVKNSIKSSKNYLIINKGKKDSIYKEMGVISSRGIIGVISSVSKNYSSVISVLNTDLQINAKFKKNNAFGSLNWDGKKINQLKLYDIPVINDVRIGDTIVTGGMSTYFPDGIFIGLVSNYSFIAGKGYYNIDVELNNSIGNEVNVYIINNLNQLEIKNLE